jgi:glycosyltransferase involved in cell wall biosynthesis
VPPQNSGWILLGIAKEIKSRLLEKKCKIVQLGDELPNAEIFFFMHYMFFYSYLLNNCLIKKKIILYVTHFESEKHKVPDFLILKLLNKASGLVCMNSSLETYLAARGVNPMKTTTIIGGADHKRFKYVQSAKKDFIGLSSAFYDRKSPDKIYRVIKNMPTYNFLLLGKKWENYHRFNELLSLDNFTYLDIDYEDYPKYYSKMKVFLSLSILEGGPIPLIEAMFCNAFPVVTDTGFARDVICHGENGFIIPIDSDHFTVQRYIEKAFSKNYFVCETVNNFSWNKFCSKIIKKLL